jgi:hypothetical protein
MSKHASAQPAATSRSTSLALRLGAQATMGVALGLCFCLLAVLVDPADITSMVAHDAEPWTTALILVSFFALTFGTGAALTGMVLTGMEKR